MFTYDCGGNLALWKRDSYLIFSFFSNFLGNPYGRIKGIKFITNLNRLIVYGDPKLSVGKDFTMALIINWSVINNNLLELPLN